MEAVQIPIHFSVNRKGLKYEIKMLVLIVRVWKCKLEISKRCYWLRRQTRKRSVVILESVNSSKLTPLVAEIYFCGCECSERAAIQRRPWNEYPVVSDARTRLSHQHTEELIFYMKISAIFTFLIDFSSKLFLNINQ